MRFLVALLVAALVASASAAASMPRPPSTARDVPTYVNKHAPTLVREYTRATLIAANPGGISDEAVTKISKRTLDDLRTKPVDVQMQRLAYMHSRVP